MAARLLRLTVHGHDVMPVPNGNEVDIGDGVDIGLALACPGLSNVDIEHVIEMGQHVGNTEFAAGPVAWAIIPQVPLYEDHVGRSVPVEEVVDRLLSNLCLDLCQLVNCIPVGRAIGRYETDIGNHSWKCVLRNEIVCAYTKGRITFQFFPKDKSQFFQRINYDFAVLLQNLNFSKG